MIQLEPIERETVIVFNDEEEFATIYTSQKPMMTKLDKLCKNNSDTYKLVREDEVSKTYECPKELIGFRSPREKKELSEEQREELRKRGRKLAEFRANKISNEQE